jgi:hypothetical protein
MPYNSEFLIALKSLTSLKFNFMIIKLDWPKGEVGGSPENQIETFKKSRFIFTK